jgi:tryptophanyl-tRNA synthetase
MTENTEDTKDVPVSSRPRVLSGMRPTGRLHLGNYMGALYNWVKLQHQYECYFFIADYHALTTDYADPSRLQENTLDVALDFLAAGLDPEHCTIFIQSHVPQHAELNLLFSMFTPLSWLERVPSYKDQQEQLREKDLATFGFLGYPLLQAADILLYKPDFVPVGQDQVAHVEVTREVARRFNHFYSPRLYQSPKQTRKTASSEHEKDGTVGNMSDRVSVYKLILPEPQVLLTPSPKLPGIDGRKMSKSYGNTIMLTDQPQVVRSKMEQMSNGGQRFIQSEPGDPDVCPVGDMHQLFSPEGLNLFIREGCRTATIGCLQCKQLAGDSICQKLKPLQDRRFHFEQNMHEVVEILSAGASKATQRAEATILEIRDVMGLSRNLSVKRVETSVDRVFRAIGTPVVHNLAAKKEWWDLEPTLRTGKLQSYWLEKMVPFEVSLRRDSERVFITPHKKRVYVTTSREREAGVWDFYAKPKSYEVLAILCWDKSFKLYDFIVPQKVYVDDWSRLKKVANKEDIHFQVERNGDAFTFQLDGAEKVDISNFQSKYETLQ